MTTPLISIIVPCYNAESFLDKTLTSVLDQTYTNWECILVNDGSKDNTEIIAEKWTKTDNRFKYIYQDNQGLSGARNTGLLNTCGDYVYFLDSDDLLDPKTLKNLSELMTEDCDITFGIIALTKTHNNQVIGLMNHEPERLTLHKNTNKELLNLVINKPLICVACNRLYRKAFLNEHNLTFKRSILHEDEFWFFETLFYAKGIILNDLPTYYYNQGNANSITNNYTLRNLESLIEIINNVYKNYYLKFPDLQQTTASYLTYLKYLTIVQIYCKIKKQDKKAANTLIKSCFKETKLNNFAPNLNNSKNELYKEFNKLSYLNANDLVKFFKYSRSNKLSRKIKKKLFLLKVKLKK